MVQLTRSTKSMPRQWKIVLPMLPYSWNVCLFWTQYSKFNNVVRKIYAKEWRTRNQMHALTCLIHHFQLDLIYIRITLILNFSFTWIATMFPLQIYVIGLVFYAQFPVSSHMQSLVRSEEHLLYFCCSSGLFQRQNGIYTTSYSACVGSVSPPLFRHDISILDPREYNKLAHFWLAKLDHLLEPI